MIDGCVAATERHNQRALRMPATTSGNFFVQARAAWSCDAWPVLPPLGHVCCGQQLLHVSHI